MKKIYLLIAITLLTINVFSQQGEWTWMNGSDSTNPTGHYGTQGIFNALNSPPGLYEACEWTDLKGNFWLFGGGTYPGKNSDLWVFRPSVNEWAWMKGPGIITQFGIYGVQGVPSPTNNPGARGEGCITWTDTSGNLWLFGGKGFDINGHAGAINDLWEYSISTNEWTWMKGPNVINDPGNYGTITVAGPNNNPQARYETSASWTQSNNNLWVFGGFGIVGSLNDLWKYNVASNQWTWMKGDSVLNPVGSYGTMGVANLTNCPNGRAIYTAWKSQKEDLWIFGGSEFPNGIHNDLWRYNITTNTWTWINGSNTLNDTTDYSSGFCVYSENNMLPSIFENRIRWTYECDNFIFYGGSHYLSQTENYNSLWSYNLASNVWTLLNGSIYQNQNRIYGSISISSPTNNPGSRFGGISWKDSLDNLWLFGGSNGYCLNDMWRYIPDTDCFHPCSVGLGIEENIPAKKSISIFPNPNNGTFTLHSQLPMLNCQLKVMDVLGRTVYSYSIDNLSIINCQLSIESGIYFWEVINDSGIIANGKLAIMK